MEPLNPVKTLQDLHSLFLETWRKTVRDRGFFFFEPRRTSQNLIERCGTSRTCSILRKSIQPYGVLFGSIFQSFETLQNLFENLHGTFWHLQEHQKNVEPYRPSQNVKEPNRTSWNFLEPWRIFSWRTRDPQRTLANLSELCVRRRTLENLAESSDNLAE